MARSSLLLMLSVLLPFFISAQVIFPTSFVLDSVRGLFVCCLWKIRFCIITVGNIGTHWFLLDVNFWRVHHYAVRFFFFPPTNFVFVCVWAVFLLIRESEEILASLGVSSMFVSLVCFFLASLNEVRRCEDLLDLFFQLVLVDEACQHVFRGRLFLFP